MKPPAEQWPEIAMNRENTEEDYKTRAKLFSLIDNPSVVQRMLIALGAKKDHDLTFDLMAEDAELINHNVDFIRTSIDLAIPDSNIADALIHNQTPTYLGTPALVDIPLYLIGSTEAGRSESRRFERELEKNGLEAATKKLRYRESKTSVARIVKDMEALQAATKTPYSDSIVTDMSFLLHANEKLIKYLSEALQQRDADKIATMIQTGILEPMKGLRDIEYFEHRCTGEITSAKQDQAFINKLKTDIANNLDLSARITHLTALAKLGLIEFNDLENIIKDHLEKRTITL